MSEETTAPATPAEGTSTVAPETTTAPGTTSTDTTTASAQPTEPARDAEKNRRVIEAAKAERRRVEAERQAKEHAARIAEAEGKLSAREKALAEREAKLEAFERAKAEALRNPRKWREESGLSLEDLVQAELNDGSPTAEMLARDVERKAAEDSKSIRDEVEKLKAALAEKDAKEQAAREERAVQQIQSAISTHVSQNAEKYELITALEQEAEVFELMRLQYQQNVKELGPELAAKNALSPAQAADMIEDFLFQQAQRAAKSKKISALFTTTTTSTTAAPAASAAKPATAKQTDSDARANKASATLTNSKVTSPATPAEPVEPLLSTEEFAEQQAIKLRELKKQRAQAAAAARK